MAGSRESRGGGLKQEGSHRQRQWEGQIQHPLPLPHGSDRRSAPLSRVRIRWWRRQEGWIWRPVPLPHECHCLSTPIDHGSSDGGDGRGKSGASSLSHVDHAPFRYPCLKISPRWQGEGWSSPSLADPDASPPHSPRGSNGGFKRQGWQRRQQRWWLLNSRVRVSGIGFRFLIFFVFCNFSFSLSDGLSARPHAEIKFSYVVAPPACKNMIFTDSWVPAVATSTYENMI